MTVRFILAIIYLLLAGCGEERSQLAAPEREVVAARDPLGKFAGVSRVALDREEVRCRLSNGFVVELLPAERTGEFYLLVVDRTGEIIDPTWLRTEGDTIVEMETNGGIASMEAIGKEFHELRQLPRSSVAEAPRCREPMKDGTL